jgi:hypothetical protein
MIKHKTHLTYYTIADGQKRMKKTEIYFIGVIKYVCNATFKHKDSIKHRTDV